MLCSRSLSLSRADRMKTVKFTPTRRVGMASYIDVHIDGLYAGHMFQTHEGPYRHDWRAAGDQLPADQTWGKFDIDAKRKLAVCLLGGPALYFGGSHYAAAPEGGPQPCFERHGGTALYINAEGIAECHLCDREEEEQRPFADPQVGDQCLYCEVDCLRTDSSGALYCATCERREGPTNYNGIGEGPIGDNIYD